MQLKAVKWCTLMASTVIAVPTGLPATRPTAARPLVIGVLSYEKDESSAPDSISRNAERGLALGFEEARQTARLFGRDVEEKRVVIARTDDAGRAARAMARTAKISALIATNPELLPAAESLPRRGYSLIVVRVVLSPAPLECSKFTFAVFPPSRLLDEVFGASSAGGPVTTTLWNSSLERFGALELNDRFRARWKTGMTGEAWAAWVAVKILSEASLRRESAAPLRILDYITKSEFDGHKGWPLTFRAGDHILRQPIYSVSVGSTSRVEQELPRGPRSQTQSAAATLDLILKPRSDPACSTNK